MDILEAKRRSLEEDWSKWNEQIDDQQRQRQEQIENFRLKGVRPMTKDYEENPYIEFDQYDLQEHIEKRSKEAKLDSIVAQGNVQQHIRQIEHRGVAKECERLGISIEEGYALLNDPELYSLFESLRENTSAGALRMAARKKGIEPRPKKQPQTREQMAKETSEDFQAIERQNRRIGTDDWLDDHLKRVLPDDDRLLHYGVESAPLPPSRRRRKR